MNTYTPMQYMLIDAATQFGNGIDKALFEERIEWAKDKLEDGSLYAYALTAENPVLFAKCVRHINKVLIGEPTGFIMGLDASASGLQIMACLTGCKRTAELTGLVNPTSPSDVYTSSVESMNKYLDEKDKIGLGGKLTRKDVKQAIMTYFYGSEAKPKEVLGEDTEAYHAFFRVMAEDMPGAFTLRKELIDSWQADQLEHSWTLPDNHTALCRSMVLEKKRIEVSSLGGATFTHQHYVNQGTERGLSNAANIVHSVDGYVVREMIRRASFDRQALESWKITILCTTALESNTNEDKNRAPSLGLLINKGFLELSVRETELLLDVIDEVLSTSQFSLSAIHDSFWCSPLHVQTMRENYVSILAGIADSSLLESILNEVYDVEEGTYEKLSEDLSTSIRSSNYAIH